MAANESRDGTYGEKLAAVMAASGFRWEAIDFPVTLSALEIFRELAE